VAKNYSFKTDRYRSEGQFVFALSGILFAGFCFLYSCSSATDSIGAGDDDDVSGGITSAQIQTRGPELIGGFPVDLSLSSPFAPVKGDSELDETIPFYDYRSRLDSTWTKLNSERIQQCVRDFSDVKSATPPNCFGPAIEYQGHPDGTPLTGSFSQGALSNWSNFTPAKEACAAAQFNYKLTEIRYVADLGFDGIKLIFCAANLIEGRAKVSLPFAENDESDLTASINDLLIDQKIGGVIDSMTITRLADLDSNEVYETNFLMTRDDGSVIDAKLRHIKVEQNNSLYKGKLSVSVTHAVDSDVDGVEAISVLYSKDIVNNMDLEIRSGLFPSSSTRATIFDANESLLAPVGSDSNYSWGIFSIDPLD